MAATTVARPGGASRGRWLTAGVVTIIVAIVAGLALSQGTARPAATGPTTVPVTRGELVAAVAGSGTIEAARTVDLTFRQSGAVAEVLVMEGEPVTAGQPLARLDARTLQSQVESARAGLASAEARLEQARGGNATEQDLAASQAALASAEAQLRSAQAQLDALRNPSADAISSAEYSLRQAEIDLQSQRDNSSASKTRAEQDLQKAVASLTQAQSSYATAKSNWDFVSETGQDPSNPESRDSTGNVVKNRLTDTQRQQYYDTFVQAEAQLKSAEQSVAQAQVAFDNARQQEVANIGQAEAGLANAQAQLAALRSPSASDIRQRQAAVDQARAGVEQAQANLAKLSASSTSSDIAIQEAAVRQAEQTLAQAELALEQATLVAPFAGVVTGVNIVEGSVAGSGATAAVSVLSRDPLHIDLTLSENDVAKVALGQPVAVTIDALRDWSATGEVAYIAPAATESGGVVTYQVRVDVADTDPRVLVGMTANLSIETARKDGVLLVPNTALLPKGAGRVVQVPGEDGRGVREVEVQTGLTDGVSTEVVSGLSEGDRVVATPSIGGEQQRQGGPFGG